MNHPPGSGVAALLQIIFLPIDERGRPGNMDLAGGVRELKLPLRIIAARPRTCTPIICRVNNFPCFVRLHARCLLAAASLASGHCSPFFHVYDKPVYLPLALLPLSLSPSLSFQPRASSLCFNPETSSPAADKAGQRRARDPAELHKF